ncbi:30S ribosomal protein S5 [bacterium]|nr:30S ribosomal protein S5 [bacterium]
MPANENLEEGLEERLIAVNRVSKVVKGGRNLSFNAIVAVGDGNGSVGVGLGKAPEVSDAIRKSTEKARKSMVRIPTVGDTIPHAANGKCGGSKVILKPASPGTGVIAGGVVRAIMETAGIKDILTKALGSTTPCNLAKATMNALLDLEDMYQVAKRREIPVEKLRG